ncbi:MAG: hypothetical protein OEZ22_08725 [Spirochaetia bacterium]|nr:hypothetical protein [Spirochaetia bacterium]
MKKIFWLIVICILLNTYCANGTNDDSNINESANVYSCSNVTADGFSTFGGASLTTDICLEEMSESDCVTYRKGTYSAGACSLTNAVGNCVWNEYTVIYYSPTFDASTARTDCESSSYNPGVFTEL